MKPTTKTKCLWMIVYFLLTVVAGFLAEILK